MHKKCQIRLLEEKPNQSERGIMPDKMMYTEKEKIFIEILGWCQARSDLRFLLDCKKHKGVTIEITFKIDVLLHRPVSHPTISYWIG